MENEIAQMVSDYLAWPYEQVLLQSNKAATSYRRYEVPKKNGRGNRTIFHPSKITKALQYAVWNLLLRSIRPHKSAMAYTKRASPLLTNAQTHASYNFSVRVDLKDFFPSIRFSDLLPYLEDNSDKIFGRKKKIAEAEKAFLKRVLFTKYSNNVYGLAIGAPTSPVISNIVMLDIDSKMQSYAQSFNNAYTRYADDFIYSSNKKGRCNEFYNYLSEYLSSCEAPNLTINTTKTIYMSKGTKRVVTGLVIGSDGSVSIGRTQKRKIKKMVYDYSNKMLAQDDIQYLKGYIAFLKDVDSKFYSWLCYKYSSPLIDSISSND